MISVATFPIGPVLRMAILLPCFKSTPLPMVILLIDFCQSKIRPLPLGYLIAIGCSNPSWAVYIIFLNSISFIGEQIIRFGIHLRYAISNTP